MEGATSLVPLPPRALRAAESRLPTGGGLPTDGGGSPPAGGDGSGSGGVCSECEPGFPVAAGGATARSSLSAHGHDAVGSSAVFGRNCGGRVYATEQESNCGFGARPEGALADSVAAAISVGIGEAFGSGLGQALGTVLGAATAAPAALGVLLGPTAGQTLGAGVGLAVGATLSGQLGSEESNDPAMLRAIADAAAVDPAVEDRLPVAEIRLPEPRAEELMNALCPLPTRAELCREVLPLPDVPAPTAAAPKVPQTLPPLGGTAAVGNDPAAESEAAAESHAAVGAASLPTTPASPRTDAMAPVHPASPANAAIFSQPTAAERYPPRLVRTDNLARRTTGSNLPKEYMSAAVPPPSSTSGLQLGQHSGSSDEQSGSQNRAASTPLFQEMQPAGRDGGKNLNRGTAAGAVGRNDRGARGPADAVDALSPAVIRALLKRPVNMVLEIPRFATAKLEIATRIRGNPIVHDMARRGEAGPGGAGVGHADSTSAAGAVASSKGVDAGRSTREHSVSALAGAGSAARAPGCCVTGVRYLGSPMYWNYGALPQTWESCEAPDPGSGLFGDGDPLDVVEIGSGGPYAPGAVLPVRVLGCLGVVDEGSLDWKILALNEAEYERHFGRNGGAGGGGVGDGAVVPGEFETDVGRGGNAGIADSEAGAAGAAGAAASAAGARLDRFYPHTRSGVREYFRWYKFAETGRLSDFLAEGRWMGAERAMREVLRAHLHWRRLLASGGRPSLWTPIVTR